MGSAQKGYLFQIIDELRSKHSLCVLIHHSGLSRSGYYKWKKKKGIPSRNDMLKEHILSIYSLRPYYGYRRMVTALKREGFAVNHKRVYRLMRVLCIQSIIRKKRRYFGKSGSIVFNNLLERDFSAPSPRKKFATDITYLPTTEGFIYLSVIQDLYNNEIVAHSFSSCNDLNLVLTTLDKLPISPDAVIHSDQGFQYTHKLYQQQLTKLQLQGSHSRKGNCLDNACVESFFSHLKTEVFLGSSLMNKEQTIAQLEEHIRFYNEGRFQKRLGQLSPVEYREKLAA